MPSPDAPTPTTGLILTGGGARAAYQAGVLRAISRIRRESGAPPGNPFPIIVGTSSGAINASGLGCRADDFDAAVEEMAQVWVNFHVDQIYRADAASVIRTGAKWLGLFTLGWAISRWRNARPRSFLDNTPLAELLQRIIDFDRLHAVMHAGHLQALAVSASSYSSGQHVTFFESVRDVEPWVRTQRIARRDRLTVHHLLASAAIPFIFPSIGLKLDGRTEYFGDGSMRQVAPISPAVHLGAERVLVVGAGRMMEPAGTRVVSRSYPSLAQIAGHAMSNIFLDALAVDVERIERVNHTLQLIPPEDRAKSKLRHVDLLVIAPSERLDDIAAKHLRALPLTIRSMLRALGVSSKGRGTTGGSALGSYLLFESDYTRELVELGEKDTEARRADVCAFFGWDSAATPRPQPGRDPALPPTSFHNPDVASGMTTGAAQPAPAFAAPLPDAPAGS